MTLHKLLAGPAAMLLTACGEPPPPTQSVDNPFLWEVANADGQVEGWLYGTIHALPDGVTWRNGAIAEVIDAADYLVLEVANIDDSSAIAAEFQRMGRSAGHPLLSDRVGPTARATLAELAEQTPYSPQEFQQIETWAAALMLAQAIRTDAKSANGVDKALLREFRDRRVAELEGATRQFAVFDGLAEADQRDLLSAVIDEAQEGQDAASAATLWLSGDLAALEEESRRGMLADPELRQALLVDRNRDWADQAVALFKEQQRPLIGVGAAHLAGPDGLVALLSARGFTVRRLP